MIVTLFFAERKRFLLTLALIVIGLLGIASQSGPREIFSSWDLWTSTLRHQLQFIMIALVGYLIASRLGQIFWQEAAFPLYGVMIVMLIGLFFVEPIQHVHRWYRAPFDGMTLQPSEFAKVTTILALAAFLSRREGQERRLSTLFLALLIAFIPAILILKEPDLGTAIVLWPVTLGMLHLAGVCPKAVRYLSFLMLCGFLFILAIFLGLLPFEELKGPLSSFMREYQYERLNPDNYHQKAARVAMGLGGFAGSGFASGSYSREGFLPFSHTDAIFPALVEEFGFFGGATIITIFFSLIYCIFQVTALSREPFGRLVSAGVGLYFATHLVINVGMMVGLLPVTGVPLLLMSYGGSSLMAAASALGIVQSIHRRRFGL